MSKKLMNPNTTIWWVPLSPGFANPAAPTAAELNAGTNISGAIATGYKLEAMAPDLDKSATIVDEGNIETPTIGNYEADITLFRDNLSDTPGIFTTAFAIFKHGPVQGWLVSRHGKKANTTAVATDEVSLFKVESDWYSTVDGAKGTPIQAQIPFFQLGEYHLNVALA